MSLQYKLDVFAAKSRKDALSKVEDLAQQVNIHLVKILFYPGSTHQENWYHEIWNWVDQMENQTLVLKKRKHLLPKEFEEAIAGPIFSEDKFVRFVKSVSRLFPNDKPAFSIRKIQKNWPVFRKQFQAFYTQLSYLLAEGRVSRMETDDLLDNFKNIELE